MTGESDPVPLAVRTSDLPVRAASALVMVAVAGAMLWLGDLWLDMFIGAVAVLAFAELAMLVGKATNSLVKQAAGILAGLLYVSFAAYVMIELPKSGLAFLIVGVIFVDTFAYFFGRIIGGPKIAPRISPSKTWAGLFGGSVGAALCIAVAIVMMMPIVREVRPVDWLLAPVVGTIVAIVAQAGDFFESWLKRKAGVKDSSRLIPGHGGVLDRVDGLLSVAVVLGIVKALT